MKQSDAAAIISDMIARAQADGILPWHKSWKELYTAQQNLFSGHKYRGSNLFILMAEGRSPFFATFNSVKKNGGYVKKGSKGYKIVHFKPVTSTDSKGNEKKSFIPSKWTVFNYADIEGIPSPELPTAEELREHTPIESCESVVRNWQAMPPLSHGGDRACYSPKFDKIMMPTAEQFDNAEEYYSTLFHEMAHATGHKSRLDRRISNPFGSLLYSREELVAELTACLIRVHCQIDDNRLIDNSAAYLKNWAKKLEDDPTMFTYAASKAQAAFDMIVGLE